MAPDLGGFFGVVNAMRLWDRTSEDGRTRVDWSTAGLMLVVVVVLAMDWSGAVLTVHREG